MILNFFGVSDCGFALHRMVLCCDLKKMDYGTRPRYRHRGTLSSEAAIDIAEYARDRGTICLWVTISPSTA